ncbi:MAG: hypothetical protein AYK18_17190 [Theionarchaea archaeon DG-70]|nr:MAG: hypothetical protein AYK18_17190 [Theionarchaea archaeon DG-70]
MTEKIRFFVSDSGEVALDLSGFKGDTCATCAKKLNDILAEYGVHLDLEEMTEKEEETEIVRQKNVIQK